MKKLILFGIIMAGIVSLQFLATCSNPLDPDEVLDNGQPNPGPGDTVFVVDTVIVEDTIISYDTVFIVDSSAVTDTVIVVDTVYDIDTVIVVDSSHVTDTLYIIDTVFNTDTIVVVDTTTVTDTLIVIDTVINSDTVTIIDTQYVVDTIFVYDTTTLQDTIIIVVPDSTGPFVYCSRLGSNQQEVVWMFHNSAGAYHLEISAAAERLKPEPQLIVTVDGVGYDWNLAESLKLALDQPLLENATIVIERAKPNPYGHALDLCIYIERQNE